MTLDLETTINRIERMRTTANTSDMAWLVTIAAPTLCKEVKRLREGLIAIAGAGGAGEYVWSGTRWVLFRELARALLAMPSEGGE